MTAPPKPRWLTDEETDSWFALYGVMIKLPFALDTQLQNDAGISQFEYQVMAGLSERAERTMRMGQLAVLTNGSLSRLSHVVNRLEKRGWVRRIPDPDDGRYTLAILTDSGWDKVVETAPGHVEAVRTFVFDVLTAEQARQLRDIGTSILNAVDPNAEC